MKKSYLYIFIVLIVTSCALTKSVNFDDISKIYLDYNPVTVLNFGTTFEAKFLAQTYVGDEVNVTNKNDFTYISTDIEQIGRSKEFKIIKRPLSFNDTIIQINIEYKSKEAKKEFSQSIPISLYGNLLIDVSGTDQMSNTFGSKSTFTTIFTTGSSGTQGRRGFNGGDADNLDVFIWQENNQYFVLVKNTSQEVVWKYRLRDAKSLQIFANGGDGGNGQQGVSGRDGRNGSVVNGNVFRARDGGDGGDGGNGGNGGRGGSVNVSVHESARDIIEFIEVKNDGGLAGSGGPGGEFGRGGIGVKGYANGRNGRRGFSGFSGQNASNGARRFIRIVDFDPKELIKS